MDALIRGDRATDSAAFLSVVVRSTVKGNGVRIGLGWRVRHHREGRSGFGFCCNRLSDRPEVMGSDHRTKGTSQEPVQHSSSLNLACTEFLLCIYTTNY